MSANIWGPTNTPPRAIRRAPSDHRHKSSDKAQAAPTIGPHHCAGAHVARRTVGKIILPMLFDRFPNMTLPDREAVQWRGFGFRGPINLPVVLN